MALLAADMGGTKTLVALYDRVGDRYVERRSERYESGAFPDAAGLLGTFLDGEPDRPEAAALGIAGPVIDDRCETTNLPWLVDARGIESALSIPRVTLLNDFVAGAHGVTEVADSDIAVLQDRPRQPDGPIAIIGAGTGLGAAVVVPNPEGYRILATEAGHAAFAPRDETEVLLWRDLLAKHGRVSVERVLSGAGLTAIYERVVRLGLTTSTSDPTEILQSPDPAQLIGERAVARSCDACMQAADIFLSAYGAEAGDFALRTLPTGGLFISGGIAPKLLPLLTDGSFLHTFRDKGRMRQVVESIWIGVIMNPRVSLLGARRVAETLLRVSR